MTAAGKSYFLSSEVSRCRAVLAGGADSRSVLGVLRQWELRVPMRGSRRVVSNLFHWNGLLCTAIQDALPLGAPIGRLLREIQPMVRKEERQWSRLQGIERQFAFQGAIALVLPWAVAALSGGIELNGFTAAGAGFQALGLGAFYLMLARATRRKQGEAAWVFDLALAAWMRVLAGMSLYAALVASLKALPAAEWQTSWNRWVAAYDSGSPGLENFDWPKTMEHSPMVAGLLLTLLRSGAPAGEALADWVSQADDERQFELEERLSGIPTRLSLIFCGFFAPAVFLVLMGGLWPTLKNLSF